MSTAAALAKASTNASPGWTSASSPLVANGWCDSIGSAPVNSRSARSSRSMAGAFRGALLAQSQPVAADQRQLAPLRAEPAALHVASMPLSNEGLYTPQVPNEPTGLRHCMVVYAPYPLGETRVQREAEALVDAGYEVDVICMRDEGEPAPRGAPGRRDPPPPCGVRQVQPGPPVPEPILRFLVLATIRLTALHRRRRYDTIQVHNLPDFLVFCAIVPKIQGVPVILDLHDLMPEFFRGRFGRDRHRRAAAHDQRGKSAGPAGSRTT